MHQNDTAFDHVTCRSSYSEASNIPIDLPNCAIFDVIDEDVFTEIIELNLATKYGYLLVVQRACGAEASRQKAIWLHFSP